MAEIPGPGGRVTVSERLSGVAVCWLVVCAGYESGGIAPDSSPMYAAGASHTLICMGRFIPA